MSTQVVEGRAFVPAGWGTKALNDVEAAFKVKTNIDDPHDVVVPPQLDYMMPTFRTMVSECHDTRSVCLARHLGGISIYASEGFEKETVTDILGAIAEHYKIRFHNRADLQVAWHGDGFPGGEEMYIWKDGCIPAWVAGERPQSDHSAFIYLDLLKAVADYGVDFPSLAYRMQENAPHVRANCSDKDWQNILEVTRRLPAHMKSLRDALNTM